MIVAPSQVDFEANITAYFIIYAIFRSGRASVDDLRSPSSYINDCFPRVCNEDQRPLLRAPSRQLQSYWMTGEDTIRRRLQYTSTKSSRLNLSCFRQQEKWQLRLGPCGVRTPLRAESITLEAAHQGNRTIFLDKNICCSHFKSSDNLIIVLLW